MSMSDCSECWSTPCTCGHDYEGWSEENIIKQIEMLQRVLEEIRKKRTQPKK